MAVLRVRDDVIVMQTMLWPDEIRAADFAAVDDDEHATSRRSRWRRCSSTSWPATSSPSEYEDDYASAVKELVRAKVEGGEVRERRRARGSGEVVDLLAALPRSVEKAKAARGEAPTAAKSAPAPRPDDRSGGHEDDGEEGRRPRRPPRRRPSRQTVDSRKKAS